MNFYRYEELCLCDAGGDLPPEAVPCGTPFAPLVFVVRRDPRRSRGLFAITDLNELEEPEGTALLAPGRACQSDCLLAQLVQDHGATVLNTAFSRGYGVLQRVLHPKTSGFRVHLVGLGDVGGTVLLGLKLLGKELSSIGIYDPNAALCQRYALELNQVLPEQPDQSMPEVEIVTPEHLFDCDALLFTASLGVPPVGQAVQDVRMVQYTRNRDMLKSYSRQARESGFCGLFAQISDPVDHLCRWVFLESNRTPTGEFDAQGLLPEQIQGYGLGVMRARAAYYARQRGIDFSQGQVFGPHGQQLIVANCPDSGYDPVLCAQLTQDTVTANLKVRELGFKPYLAPGLSSAAISVLRTLRGQWHDGAVAMDGAYFGCTCRMSRQGLALLRQPLAPALAARLEQTHRDLREFDYDK